jgi:hypothetical protein
MTRVFASCVLVVMATTSGCRSGGGADAGVDRGVGAGADGAADRGPDGDDVAHRDADGGGVADRGGGADAVAGADAAPGDGGAPRPCPGSKPDATNTGVPAGVTLTVINQDVTVTQDGTTIDAQDIHGFLTIQASHVRVTRSIVRGRATTSNAGVIRVSSGTDILIEDTEIAVAAPSATVDGMWSGGVVARRLDIHGGVDGIKAGSGDTIECSYIHDLASFASDPNQGGGPTHNDAIQILEGTGIRIVANQLVAATDQNAAIQITQDFGAVADVRIEGNWADGGGCTFNISHNGAATLTGVAVTGNRFGRASFFDCPILKSTQTTLVSSGNVWDDDGTPVPTQTHD